MCVCVCVCVYTELFIFKPSVKTDIPACMYTDRQTGGQTKKEQQSAVPFAISLDTGASTLHETHSERNNEGYQKASDEKH